MKASYFWAFGFALLIAGWFISGDPSLVGLDMQPLYKASAKAEPVAEKKPDTEKLFRVEVKLFKSRIRNSSLMVHGRTEIDKKITVRARTPGIVEQAPLKEGDRVKAGQLLCRLDMKDRKARLAEAKARMASARRDYYATSKLAQRKFASIAKQASDKARYDAAVAAVEQIELEMKWVNITAPIDATVTELQGEQGSYLQPGQACATLSVFDPILVSAQVGERDISKLKTGQSGTAKLVTGEKVAGTLSFISPNADIATRTFKVEMKVDNHDHSLRDGVTAEITFPLPDVKAHLLPAGIIGLNDAGVIGVKLVDEKDRVKFYPVKILGQTRKGSWVSGLPDQARIIINGQDYVLEGQMVETAVKGSQS